MDLNTNQTYSFNNYNGHSQWEQPTTASAQPIQKGLAAETAEVKAAVEIKQEERQKEFKRGATDGEAKAVRVGTNEAVRKAEKKKQP